MVSVERTLGEGRGRVRDQEHWVQLLHVLSGKTMHWLLLFKTQINQIYTSSRHKTLPISWP